MRKRLFSWIMTICVSVAGTAVAQKISAPDPQPGTIIGTVTDVNGGTIAGASVELQGASASDHNAASANDSGFFEFDDLKPGMTYRVIVSARGFANWNSSSLLLKPGEHLELTDVKLQIAQAVTTVNAVDSTEQIATEQTRIEEKQRVLGIMPNFYVVYDPNPVPLTTKLKFDLALRTSVDPVTFLGAAFLAGMDQADDTPNFGQGAKAYGQRVGVAYTDGFTDILIGGAVLPWLLHQDPRYFYQGTGTTKSRVIHALSSAFLCKGDNGHWQPNYSGIGGDLASGALSNAYYPESNRGPGLVFSVALIDTGARMANGLIQEFVLRRFTPSAKNQP